MAASDRFRLLVIAYACNPYQGSEEGVGWGWVRAIAGQHEVDVITAGFHRRDIERALADQAVAPRNVTFHYVIAKPWHYRPNMCWRFIETSAAKPLMNVAYAAWQRDAYRLACRLHAQVGFDLVHLVTYVGFRFPGQFWKMDIPLVWGPIGGLENTPWRFLPLLGPYGCAYFACRNIINSLQKRFLPGPKRAFAKAAGAIIAATEGIRREIHHWYGQESLIISEIGPPREIAAAPTLREPGEPLRLIWSGRHLSGKALPLLLKALALLDGRGIERRRSLGEDGKTSRGHLDWRLTVLGAGPNTLRWQRICSRLAIARNCAWPGWIARDEAVRLMSQAHVCVITSMKDLTSTVLVEALAAGLPVICPDHCGFANVVTPDCGIKLPLRSPRQLVVDLAAAIERLGTDETERRRLAAGALLRVGGFSWENKARLLDGIYRRAVCSRSMPPVSAPFPTHVPDD